jgi:DNA-3-methyladenine glycosylase II
MSTMHIPVPKEFNYETNLQFLQRSPRELLHTVEGNTVIKLLRVDGQEILFTVKAGDDKLIVTFLNSTPSAAAKKAISSYIIEWFDLETDLKPFYSMVSKDKLLGDLIRRHFGYRIIGQPDLFESLVWAVLGQQINLQFAYTLKQRFVEKFGTRFTWDERDHFLFPQPDLVATLNDDLLLPLQFSRQKSKYTVNIGEAFATGVVSKEKLRGLPLIEAKEELMKIKGIGNWTANYALMKTFRYPDAFPLEDAGIHNAIKNLKKMKTKPTLDQVRRVFKKYKGWEAYATLYLWKSLVKE